MQNRFFKRIGTVAFSRFLFFQKLKRKIRELGVVNVQTVQNRCDFTNFFTPKQIHLFCTQYSVFFKNFNSSIVDVTKWRPASHSSRNSKHLKCKTLCIFCMMRSSPLALPKNSQQLSIFCKNCILKRQNRKVGDFQEILRWIMHFNLIDLINLFSLPSKVHSILLLVSLSFEQIF